MWSPDTLQDSFIFTENVEQDVTSQHNIKYNISLQIKLLIIKQHQLCAVRLHKSCCPFGLFVCTALHCHPLSYTNVMFWSYQSILMLCQE